MPDKTQLEQTIRDCRMFMEELFNRIEAADLTTRRGIVRLEKMADTLYGKIANLITAIDEEAPHA